MLSSSSASRFMVDGRWAVVNCRVVQSVRVVPVLRRRVAEAIRLCCSVQWRTHFLHLLCSMMAAGHPPVCLLVVAIKCPPGDISWSPSSTSHGVVRSKSRVSASMSRSGFRLVLKVHAMSSGRGGARCS